MKMPKQVPVPGFYYHYKHDPKGPFEIYAYEVVGVGFHTEDDCQPRDVHTIVYRPLYESAAVYQASLKLKIPCVDVRPLKMWMGNVRKGGKTFPRFKRITNKAIISALSLVKRQMYGE